MLQTAQIGFSCSPHTRGCSYEKGLRKAETQVFPAYAGVFLPAIIREGQRQVFPAYAGVFLIFLKSLLIKSCVPRIRGGVPIIRL